MNLNSLKIRKSEKPGLRNLTKRRKWKKALIPQKKENVK